MIVLWLLALFLGSFGWFGAGVMFLAAFFLEWLFPAWCEARWNGATPGKRLLGLMVLNDDGSPVRWAAALTRNLLRAVDFLPFLYATGLAAMLVNRDFKRLGDLAAGTVVVYREGAHRRGADPAAAPLAPPAPLRSASSARCSISRSARRRLRRRASRSWPSWRGRWSATRAGSRRARAARGQPPGGAAMRQAAFVERHGPEWDAFEAWLTRSGPPRRAEGRTAGAYCRCRRAGALPAPVPASRARPRPPVQPGSRWTA